MTTSHSVNFRRVYVLVGALMLAAAGCRASPAQEVKEVPPAIAFEGLRFRSYRGAALAATGVARWATYRRDTTDVRAQLIEIQFPGRPGVPDLQVEAPEGAGNLRDHRLNVWGGVVAHRGREVARTDRAHYASRLVEGDTPVSLQGPGWALEGPAFHADPDTGAVRITGGGKLVVRGGVR
jgi:hypothetical protein